MKKLPFYLRLGFAIMGVDPYATPIPPEDPRPQVNRQDQNTQVTARPATQSAGQWIDMKDKLPERYKKVDIYTEDQEVLHGWAYMPDGYFVHSTDDRQIINATHWMDPGIPQQPNTRETNIQINRQNNKPTLPQ